jgi:hypothetical protein
MKSCSCSDNTTFLSTVLSNPAKRQEYDKKGILYVQDPNVVVSFYFFNIILLQGDLLVHTVFFLLPQDYLNRHKGLILTCNGLGIRPKAVGSCTSGSYMHRAAH